jgi:DNA-binding response OmpR family regulator
MSRQRILVVEDDPSIHRLVKTVLQFHGFEVLSAYNGLECLSLLRENSVDLIILDILMNGLSGYELLIRLKSSPNTEDIPVAMLSAKGDCKDMEKGLQLGAVAYFIKPIDPFKFPKEIKNLMDEFVTQNKIKNNLDSEFYEQEFKKLQNDFILEFQDRLRKLFNLVGKRDVLGVRYFGHKLKGSGYTMGFGKLSILGAKIEEEAEKEDWKELEKICKKLEDTYDELK